MLNKYFSIALLSFLLLFTSLVAKVSAHGTGASFPKEVGIYTVEFEYEDAAITAGETNAYLFRILDQKTKNPVEFDSVIVRFENKSDQSTVILAKLIQDDLQTGVGRLSAMLNEGGYNVTAAFYKGDNKIAEATYDLTVAKEPGNNAFPMVPVAAGLGGLILGFLIAKMRSPHET